MIVTIRVKKPAPIKGTDIRKTVTVKWAEAQDGLTRTVRVNGRSVPVSIPAGTPDGKTIPIAGAGKPGQHGGASGDLIVTVNVKPEPIKGADIRKTVTIKWAEAQDGLTRTVRVNRRRVSVSIPAGTPDGKTIPIAGAGKPGQHGGANGDLIVTVRFKKPAPIKGANIYRSITIEWAEAQGGLTRSLRVDGRSVSVQIPAGTKDGDKKRVAGAGKAGQHGGANGNLIVTIRVKKPAPIKGADVHETITISLQEAFTGLTRKIGAAEVEIPAGTPDGKTIPIAGAGEPGENGGENGDLIIAIRVDEDAQFRRVGDDLYTEFSVDWDIAHKGGSIEAPTLTSTASVSVPPGSKTGDELLIPGAGMPVLGQEGEFGDLIVELAVKENLYTNITIDQRTAKRGGAVFVPTIAGATANLKVPAGTKTGDKLPIPGAGMPVLGQEGEFGDLIVEVEVKPKKRSWLRGLFKLMFLLIIGGGALLYAIPIYYSKAAQEIEDSLAQTLQQLPLAQTLVGVVGLAPSTATATMTATKTDTPTHTATDKPTAPPTDIPMPTATRIVLAQPELIVGRTSRTSLRFNWDAVPGAEQYQYRYSVNNKSYTRWQTVTGLATTVFNLSPGDRVAFQVRAKRGDDLASVAHLRARTLPKPTDTATPPATKTEASPQQQIRRRTSPQRLKRIHPRIQRRTQQQRLKQIHPHILRRTQQQQLRLILPAQQKRIQRQ